MDGATGFDTRPSRSGAAHSRRLAPWQLRDINRAANDARAAGDRAVKVHGVVRWLWHPEQQKSRQQRPTAAAVDAETASPAAPKQPSKRKQRSAVRLREFRKRMELRAEPALARTT